MTENREHFESIVNKIVDAELGQMFGKPCGKMNNKVFVSFFDDEMVFKIGKEEVDSLLTKYKNSKNWDPSGKGRAMKDWIQIPQEYKADWKKLATNALEFTSK